MRILVKLVLEYTLDDGEVGARFSGTLCLQALKDAGIVEGWIPGWNRKTRSEAVKQHVVEKE